MTNRNLQTVFDTHSGPVDGIVDRVAREQAEQKARLEAFYESARFQEILNYILGHDGVIDQDEVQHFSDRHPISRQEFSDFCHAIFERHDADVRDINEGPFPEKILIARGLKVTLLIGQGSIFFVSREKASPLPAPRPAIPGG